MIPLIYRNAKRDFNAVFKYIRGADFNNDIGFYL